MAGGAGRSAGGSESAPTSTWTGVAGTGTFSGRRSKMASLRQRLGRLGLGKYGDVFAAHDVDLDVLSELTDADLEKLGISLGDRRRILKAAKDLAAGRGSRDVSSRDAGRRQLTVMFTDLVGSTK